MKIGEVNSIYFIGIGGIGMSALARYFNALGKVVEGYDKTRTSLTATLASEGIKIHYSDDVALAPENPDLVVYTPAVPVDMTELVHFQESPYPVIKRAELLAMVTEDSFTIAVAGTHGKTTTSSIVAHILDQVGGGCTAFIGGIMRNRDSNMYLGKQGDPIVVEADEYDRSFLQLSPNISVITSMDADHLDIYGEEKQIHSAFREFAHKTKKNGVILSCAGLPLEVDRTAQFTYGIKSGSDYKAINLSTAAGAYCFDLDINGQCDEGWKLNLPGGHNVENATAAIAVADQMGIALPEIKVALAGYRGVKRRFEYIVNGPNHWFIDDYAHHPSELESAIETAKAMFPGEEIVGIFQPHLYSRTQDFAKGFGKALSELDEVILMDIYPARELPIAGVDSHMLLKYMDLDRKSVLSKSEIVEKIRQTKPRVLMTLGAGDIDAEIEPIKNALLAE